MSFSISDIRTGVQPEPPRIVVYGEHKMGKSTFAANAPAPIFIQTEDGVGNLNVAKFPLAKSYDDVVSQLQVLATQDHPYQTLVIDSLDHLQPLIYAKVIQDRPLTEKGKPVKDIVDYGYGSGYEHAIDYWASILEGLQYLRDKKDMMIVCIAHAIVDRFDDPEADPYDRYELKLQDGKKVSASALVQEWADAIFFVNYAKVIKTTEVGGFAGERTRAMGSGQRFLFTEARPAFQAGNRYGLPPQIEMPKDQAAWSVLVEHIPYLKTKYGNKGE